MLISYWSSDVGSSDLLVDIEAVSQSEIDRLRATVTAATAALAGANARIAARALDVEFTTVRAPLSGRSEEHTSELQSLMRISYAVFCLKKKNNKQPSSNPDHTNSTPYAQHKYITNNTQ